MNIDFVDVFAANFNLHSLSWKGLTVDKLVVDTGVLHEKLEINGLLGLD